MNSTNINCEQISNYMTIVVGVLASESTKEYPKLASEFQLIAGEVIQKQTEKTKEHVLELCEAENLVYVSEEDRYMEILNDISQTVKAVAPLLINTGSTKYNGLGAVTNAANNAVGDHLLLASGAGGPPTTAAAANARLEQNPQITMSPNEVTRVIQTEARNLQKYGITTENLIRLATTTTAAGGSTFSMSGAAVDQAHQEGGGGMSQLPPGTSSGTGTTSTYITARDLNIEKVKETQVSLLAYAHIIQGRFVDSACMLSECTARRDPLARNPPHLSCKIVYIVM